MVVVVIDEEAVISDELLDIVFWTYVQPVTTITNENEPLLTQIATKLQSEQKFCSYTCTKQKEADY